MDTSLTRILMMGATCVAGTAYPSGAPDITLSFLVGFVLISL